MLPVTFTRAEIDKINNVKAAIKLAIHDFTLTVGKLGKSFVTDYYVSGGCTASLLRGEKPKDYDIYFRNSQFAKSIVHLYESDPSYKNEVLVLNEKYRDVENHPSNKLCITENAMTLRNGVQVITKHYGEPDAVRKTFDYVHCLPYYDSATDTFYISREQYDCCVNKILIINSANHVTGWRTQKFLEQGYQYGNNKTTGIV